MDTQDDWVRRLKSEEGRDAAIRELTSLLVRGLTRSLAGRYGSTLQPEDVAQEAILRILETLDTFQGRSLFTTWAMTVATRVGISELRRKHYQSVSLDSMASGDNLVITLLSRDEPSDARSIEREQMIDKLRHMIDTELSDRQREAVQGLLDELPIEVIAERTGSNRNAVYKLIHDARLKLRAGFQDSGICADDIAAVFA
jgi:RNA polymerase sigma factor (sigma-70 family)